MGLRKIVLIASFCLGALLLLACLLPPKRELPVLQTKYPCVWEDGDSSKESFASLYPHLLASEREKLIFLREGVRGEYSTGEGYRAGYTLLTEGTLLEMMAFDASVLSSLERVGLYRAFEHTLFYEREAFRWSGAELVRTEELTAHEIRLVSGSFADGFLAQSGAEVLFFRENCAVKAKDLVGSSVRKINAQPPYTFEEGILYDCEQGLLIFALAHIEHLTVPNCIFAIKEGALSPCESLKSLSLPFVGRREGGYFGEIFAKNGQGVFLIPPTLKKVTVRGGSVSALSFYGAEHLEEIDLRGLRAEDVHENAFEHCPSLQRLYTPAKVSLNENFACYEHENYFEYVKIL